MVSTLENHFLLRPQAEALYHATDRKYTLDLAEHVTTTLMDGCSSFGYFGTMLGYLKYISKWKEVPDKLIKVAMKASRVCELVEFPKKDKENQGGSKPGGSSAKASKAGGKSRRNDEDRSKNPITYEYGEEGHIVRYCKKKSKQGGGPERKDKTARQILAMGPSPSRKK